MKWLIVSDSHQDIAALKRVAANEQGVDCILHAGDYAKMWIA
jgi:predicted phosphodiesterase